MFGVNVKCYVPALRSVTLSRMTISLVSYNFYSASNVPQLHLRRKDQLISFQVVEDGYEFFGGRKLVTVFSAPNYCGEFDNAGALMCVDESLLCSFKVCISSS